MRTNRLLWAAVAIVLAVGPAFAQSPEPMIELPNHVSPALGLLEPSVPSPPDQVLKMMIVFAIQNQAAADKYDADQTNPSSPDYRRALGIQEFVRRYGPTQEQYSAVENWFVQQGFQITSGNQLDRVIKFTGTVQQAENAFGVNIVASDDGRNWSNINNPHIPARFAGVFGHIGGLSSLGGMQPGLKSAPSATPGVSAPRGSLQHPRGTAQYAPIISSHANGGK